MKETNTKIIMIGLCVITFLIVIGWILSPTDFSIDLSMDNNTVKATENMANVGIEEDYYYGAFGVDCNGFDVNIKLINITDSFSYEINGEIGQFVRSK